MLPGGANPSGNLGPAAARGGLKAAGTERDGLPISAPGSCFCGNTTLATWSAWWHWKPCDRSQRRRAPEAMSS